jgi:AcrR family transcriptional regulator
VNNIPKGSHSRRERPAKPALTRQGIVEAAMVILREEGLDRVTMRRIAAALDTGPASLYVYISSTEDLHAQILDALLGRLGVPPAEAGSWRERLKALLAGYRNLLFEYPEIARMALSTQPSGPNYMGMAETILGLLAEGGVSDRAAAWGVDLLLLYPTALAVERTTIRSSRRGGEEIRALAAKISSADPARYPHIARLANPLMSGEGPARSDWAFDVLLDGILFASSK